jgi:hypothetical protein
MLYSETMLMSPFHMFSPPYTTPGLIENRHAAVQYEGASFAAMRPPFGVNVRFALVASIALQFSVLASGGRLVPGNAAHYDLPSWTGGTYWLTLTLLQHASSTCFVSTACHFLRFKSTEATSIVITRFGVCLQNPGE